MNARNHFTKICIYSLLAAAMLAATLPSKAAAQNLSSSLPDLDTFIASIRNGEADTLRGIYIQNVMAYSVVQQPQGDSRFVSNDPATVTQFSMATRAGVTGLLAHNTLAGKKFFDIQQGRQIILIYGNGRTETFVVEKIFTYQTLPYGQYQDLQTQETIRIGELFDKVYSGDNHLTLQTCIEKDGNYQWGRLFIIAKPSNALNGQG